MSAIEPAGGSRRTLYVAIAVTVLLAVSIAVAAARPDANEPAKVTESPSPAKETSASAPTSAAPDSSNAVTSSKQPSPPGTKPGTSPSPQTQTSKPVEPVKNGSKLTQLKSPPERTIGMIVIPDDFKSARFAVTFTPFGWGPSGAAGGRLIAKITESEALDVGAKALNRDFTDRNATLWCSKTIADKVKVGGTYSGVLEVRRSGDTGTLFIVDIKTP